ncbi:MAG: SAM-dependent methyltransferase [Candidatus Hydrogenedentes bacterium]|nr:SAM-dependent methyltransferase [Candidatus Hydrogenedentota bacterium]
MASLDRTLRRQLENTVKQARRVAEAGARKAVESLAVHHHEPHSSMTSAQRTLRNRLRAHGRQLGDQRDERRGTQTIERLVGECAYEHWHRMLFARFLAENDLLIEPEHGVPISLDDCRELARDHGKDWLELASTYAVRMLPQIFRRDDPVLEVNLPPETRSELEDLLKALPRDVFLADDSLGWVYQFWQAEQKDAVNKSEKKIGADELPAVTQLFTEDYMVEFLLHNTLGAWWAGKVIAADPELAKNATDEDELRAACAVGRLQWTYLRFVREEGKPWRPAAGVFEHWPKAAAKLKVLDPCCGSGHFLVFALPNLIEMRMAEEGLSTKDASGAVLRDNLFGLELDSRCTQIAAFNLALAAWKAAGYHTLPRLQIACSSLSVGASKEAWLTLAKGSPKVEGGIARLYDGFRLAPTLGSLVDPRAGEVEVALLEATFDDLRLILDQLLAANEQDADTRELGVAAQGLLEAVRLLTGDYTLVATNVPYLARGKQSETLRQFAERHYADAKQDLATVFVRRCLEFVSGSQSGSGILPLQSEAGSLFHSGTVAAVTPQNWLFLTSYKKLRERLLKEQTFNVIARLGVGAFETISGEVVNTALCILSQAPPDKVHAFAGFDVSTPKNVDKKATGVRSVKAEDVLQESQRKNPDHAITLKAQLEHELMAALCHGVHGLGSKDTPCFFRQYWEVPLETEDWELMQTTVESSRDFGGMEQAVFWQRGNGLLHQRGRRGEAVLAGGMAWGKLGVIVSQFRILPVARYMGDIFDKNTAVVLPHDIRHLPAVWQFCSSEQYSKAVRTVDQSLAVTNATLVKVPFDLDYWQRVAEEQYPHGLPEPYSDDPTQWIFHGHPCGSVQWNEETRRLEVAATPRADATVLQVAVARLLGYHWPAEHDAKMRLSEESRMVMARCAELHHFADTDGIVCLSPIHKESPAAQRLTELLAAAYGEHWSAARLTKLLAAADCKGKTLDDWLRDKFFEQHCAIFHHRPFIWHIWDGLRDGLNVLVNYHKLAAPKGDGRRTLEKLIYTYLGDWITQQRREQQAGAEGADARLAVAMHLQDELKRILEGEPPYDLFIRWKPLHEQPIGWDPDINDGVRLNIRPFMTARPLNARAKNACMFRTTPKIKWDKDRGKEPERSKDDFPWFWSWDEKSRDFPGNKTFDGNRWNDLHYTNALKQAARDRNRKG